MFDCVINESNWLKMRCVSSIQPLWLLEMAPNCFDLKKLQNDKSCVTQALKELTSHHYNKN